MARPARSDADATRESILALAQEAFADADYDAVSVREIARRLGASHNLITHHFGSKAGLWRAAIDDALGRQIQDAIELVERSSEAGVDPATALRELIRRFVELAVRHPVLPRILSREALLGGERLDYLHERFARPALEVFDRFVGRVGRASAGPIDPRSFALFLAAGAMAPFTQTALAAKLLGRDPLAEEALQRHVDTVSNLVVGALFPRPA